MTETAASARETAEKYRKLAEVSGDVTSRRACLVMAEWWEQRAKELEAAAQIDPAEKPKPNPE